MTQPFTNEQPESAPSFWGLVTWAGLLLVLLAGLALYFRFANQVNPLLHLDPAR